MKTDEPKLVSLFDKLVENMDDILTNGEEVVAGDAVVRVKPKAATLNVIRQLLKDNGIEARNGPQNKLGSLADKLPTFPTDAPDDGDYSFH
jgi:hypothetical protein